MHDITEWSQCIHPVSPVRPVDPIQFYCDFKNNIRLYCVTLKGQALPSYYTLITNTNNDNGCEV